MRLKVSDSALTSSSSGPVSTRTREIALRDPLGSAGEPPDRRHDAIGGPQREPHRGEQNEKRNNAHRAPRR